MQAPDSMRAMVFDKAGSPLQLREVPVPRPADGQILIRVEACGVCRTDLHVVDGELSHPKKTLIPGHEIVGRIASVGSRVEGFAVGERVGVPWLAWTCGACSFCAAGKENLCDNARFTGYTVDGGYAEYTVADVRYCFHLPETTPAVELAPLLCAGLIGYRAYGLAGPAITHLGLYGFGAAAHILAQVARHEGKQVYSFTKDGDAAGQKFAASLGSVWAGGSSEAPPVKLDAAIIFAPVGALVPAALKCLAKGGKVVCGGIHMSDIPSFPYALLWEEREILSVANLTRNDGKNFFALVPKIPLRVKVTKFPLDQANEALSQLRSGKIEGAAVLEMQKS